MLQKKAGPPVCQAIGEERIDADHRRQVGEPHREVAEEVEHSAQVLLVAESLKLFAVLARLIAHDGQSPEWTVVEVRRRPRCGLRVGHARGNVVFFYYWVGLGNCNCLPRMTRISRMNADTTCRVDSVCYVSRVSCTPSCRDRCPIHNFEIITVEIINNGIDMLHTELRSIAVSAFIREIRVIRGKQFGKSAFSRKSASSVVSSLLGWVHRRDQCRSFARGQDQQR